MKRTPSSPSSPTHKASRTTASKSNSANNPLLYTRELEAHYAKYHAWVCQAAKPTSGTCGNVFPDARLLELHHTECHDPIAAVRKERGEKIYSHRPKHGDYI
ncbi:zinc finger protein [Lentinula edodes]|uniref:Zinc finger protein n=1 Tax=Lentinula edodes TaxID=5353 RepID=A0A1Q3E736_LENED|nr:zinc finger protein [Lentinula edodes]